MTDRNIIHSTVNCPQRGFFFEVIVISSGKANKKSYLWGNLSIGEKLPYMPGFTENSARSNRLTDVFSCGSLAACC
jgi:hypothetical protein